MRLLLQLLWPLRIWPSPPASCPCPLLAMASKGSRGHKSSLTLVTDLLADGHAMPQIKLLLKEHGFSKAKISQLVRAAKAASQQGGQESAVLQEQQEQAIQKKHKKELCLRCGFPACQEFGNLGFWGLGI